MNKEGSFFIYNKKTQAWAWPVSAKIKNAPEYERIHLLLYRENYPFGVLTQVAFVSTFGKE